MGHQAGQVKWNNEEFVPDLEKLGSRCAEVVPVMCKHGGGGSGSILVCFGAGASVFPEILLRFTPGREPGECASDFWFPHGLALWLWANPRLTSFLHL